MNPPLRLARILAISLGVLCWFAPDDVLAQTCDLNLDGTVNVGDVQSCVNMVLGLAPCTANITAPGVCDVVVVQRIVNAAIGGPCLTDTPPAGHSAALNWTASVSPNIVGHNIYRGNNPAGPYTKLNTSLVGATNYTDSTVTAGQTYYYVVTSVNGSSLESTFSNVATAVIPSP